MELDDLKRVVDALRYAPEPPKSVSGPDLTKRVGFECEYFVLDESDKLVLPKGVPIDECGYLTEARGVPHGDSFEAAFSMLAATARIKRDLAIEKMKLLMSECTIVLPAGLKQEASRNFGKGPVPATRGNLYGLSYAPGDKWDRAGLHVHFSNRDREMAKIVLALDAKFIKQIREARRLRGFYEWKSHGFEYRSLPSTINVEEVAEFIQYDMLKAK